MKLIFLVIAVITIVSCTQNGTESQLSIQKISEAKTYFSSKVKEFDSTTVIDSFKYVRLDTLVEKSKYRFVTGDLVDQMEANTQESKDLLEKYKYSIRMASLTSGLSNSLFSNYKGEADDIRGKMDELREKTMHLSALYDSAVARRSRADSTKPVGYFGVFAYQLRQKNNAVTKDTAYVVFNLDKNIVERKDFFYQIDKL